MTLKATDPRYGEFALLVSNALPDESLEQDLERVLDAVQDGIVKSFGKSGPVEVQSTTPQSMPFPARGLELESKDVNGRRTGQTSVRIYYVQRRRLYVLSNVRTPAQVNRSRRFLESFRIPEDAARFGRDGE
jgi:hypothetical protein